MKKIYSLFGAVMISCSLVGSSWGALVDVAGQNYSLDTDSGLNWLDMSQTVGRSYRSVAENMDQGQEFEGWRYATILEFEAMVTHMGGTGPYNGWSAANYGIVDGIIDIIGPTGIIDNPMSTDQRFSAGILNDTNLGGSFAVGEVLTGNYDFNGPFDYVNSYSGAFTFNQSDVRVASFLVRSAPVPEPSTYLLIGLGFLGLVCIHTQKQKGKEQVHF